MDEEQLLNRLSQLLDDLAFDYERMSKSGQATYDEICSIVNILQGG